LCCAPEPDFVDVFHGDCKRGTAPHIEEAVTGFFVMTLTRLTETVAIEIRPASEIVLRFDKLFLRMTTEEFYALASMFEIGSGRYVPDRRICNTGFTPDGKFFVSCGPVVIALCAGEYVRFATLCRNGAQQLRKVESGRPLRSGETE
jgi:hypothetical protein